MWLCLCILTVTPIILIWNDSCNTSWGGNNCDITPVPVVFQLMKQYFCQWITQHRQVQWSVLILWSETGPVVSGQCCCTSAASSDHENNYTLADHLSRNLEMSATWQLTRSVAENDQKSGNCHEKYHVRGKLFIVSFTFGANQLFTSIVTKETDITYKWILLCIILHFAVY